MLLVVSLMLSCLDNQMMTRRGKNGRFHSTEKKTLNTEFKFRVCMNYDDQKTDNFYARRFKRYSESGFNVVWVNVDGKDILGRLAPIAEQAGLELDSKQLNDEPRSEEAQKRPYANLAVAELSPKQFKNRIELAIANGAKGISVFDSADLTGDHLSVITAFSRKNK